MPARVDAQCRHACVDAEPGSPCGSGRFGAGTGTTVGKLTGHEHAVPGGIGSASQELPGGGVVGALAVVNAFGNIVGADGGLLAGAEGTPVDPRAGANTTLAVVATDVALTRDQAYRIVQRNAMQAWDDKGHLRDLLAADPEVTLTEEELAACFSLDRITETAAPVFQRLAALYQPRS